MFHNQMCHLHFLDTNSKVTVSLALEKNVQVISLECKQTKYINIFRELFNFHLLFSYSKILT